MEFWIREFSCFLLYLFNQLLFISLCTQVHLFHISGYNSVLLYLFDQIVPPLDTGSSFSWLLYPVNNSPSVWCVFFLLTTYLLSGNTRCSGFILYNFWTIVNISYFSQKPLFFLLENGVRNQDLGIGCGHCYGMSSF